MPSRMLKRIRVVIAAVFFVFTFLIFIDFTSLLSTGLIDAIVYLQFTPSLIKFLTLLSYTALGFLIITLSTFLIGRFYCSAICPLGIMQDIFIFLKRKFGKVQSYKFRKAKPWVRYGILGITIITLVTGNMFLLILLDPYSLFGKISGNLFRPLIILLNNAAAKGLSTFDIFWLFPHDIKSVSWAGIIFSLGIFILLIWMSLRYGRLYCNLICPLGTFLGLTSRFSLFKISLDQDACTMCGRCSSVCKAECIDSLNKTVDFSRCVACFNCLSSCPQEGVYFAIPRKKENTVQSRLTEVDPVKRDFLKTSGAMVLGLVASSKILQAQQRRRRFRNSKEPVPVHKEFPVAPPGAKSIDHYNAHCTACYLCVSICPTQVLQPALMAWGLKGFMQPQMDYMVNYCNFDCLKCGEVCPTGAILPLDIEVKHVTQMGKVHFIKQNCVVYTDNTDCGACSEHCPTKAVNMKPYKKTLFIPYVIPEICVGCGACEYACPTDPKSIYVDGNPVHQEADKPEVRKIEEEVSDEFPF
ncbi:MAG: 4Fe-4S binding protein [Bacteroidota bacterium]|nr:4Fe-4S binding protein [Bacteroidota bacterium]